MEGGAAAATGGTASASQWSAVGEREEQGKKEAGDGSGGSLGAVASGAQGVFVPSRLARTFERGWEEVEVEVEVAERMDGRDGATVP